LQLHLISSRYRSGIPKPSWDKSSTSPASPWLIFDVHGGGFIAQTSKTHCGYLFPLAIETNVPVVCVNYSLAPEMQYPTQLHQVIVANTCLNTELPAYLLQVLNTTICLGFIRIFLGAQELRCTGVDRGESLRTGR
jgi:hypothetical protein